jgi:hypothetical protein
MPKLQLECNTSSSDVTLGRGQKSKNNIVVRLTNDADETVKFSGLGARGTLSLTASIGTQAKDLVATQEEASSVKIASAANWKRDPNQISSAQVTWSFPLPKEVLKAKEQTSLTLTDFECHTDPGKAQLTLRVAVDGYEDYQSDKLGVEKKTTDVLQILYFRAEPPLLITKEDKAAFALEWNTLKAHKVSLLKVNDPLLTLQEGEENFRNGQRFSYRKERPSLPTMVYKLVAMDRVDPTKQDQKEVTVYVLEGGWRRLDEFRSNLGYPSVLCNLDGVKLYGIWVKQGKADLYSSAHPWAAWNPENKTVPEKMETSPAVCFANQLWLIGGSAADPRTFSKQIWCYEPQEERRLWSRKADADWSPRMGHACVVMKNRVWVLGGMDADGRALKEVWSWDGNGKWTRHPEAGWPARCMPAVTVFKDRIWIYGGVTEPFGDPLEDMWTSGDGENWERRNAPQDDDRSKGKPIGCTLQVLNKELNLLGTFRTATTTPSWQFILQEKQQTWRPSLIPDEKAWDQQEGNTFSLSSVEYKGLVFLRSLDYRTADNPTNLNMFVP